MARPSKLRVTMTYLRAPTLEFLPLLGTLLAVVFLGGWVFQTYHPETRHFSSGVYSTYCLLFAEHVHPWPNHPAVQLIYVVVPLLGLVVLLDGVVRYSVFLTRFDETRREWMSAVAANMQDHVILCGLGRAGFRVLQELVKLGEDVVVVEENPDCQYIEFARLHQIPVFISKIPSERLLPEVGLDRAKSIILCTNDDLSNLETSLDARKINPKVRVVLRMYDQDLAAKVQDSVGIDAAFSRSQLAAPVFASSSSDASIKNAFYVGGRLLVVAELVVKDGSGLIGRTVAELRDEFRSLVLAHGKSGKPGFWPGDTSKVSPGDRLTVQTEPPSLKRLHKLNAGD